MHGRITLYWTEAPRAYDGFGTVTVYDGGRQRLVAIEPEYDGWQRDRYASGMYAATAESTLSQVEVLQMIQESVKGHLEDMIDSQGGAREHADEVLLLTALLARMPHPAARRDEG